MSFGVVLSQWLRSSLVELTATMVMMTLPQSSVVVEEMHTLPLASFRYGQQCQESYSCEPVSEYGQQTSVLMIREASEIEDGVSKDENSMEVLNSQLDSGEATDGNSGVAAGSPEEENPKEQTSPTPTPAATDAVSTPVVTQPAAPDPDNFSINTAVNTYRTDKGLAALQSQGDLCGIAEKRAGEVEGHFNHDGFTESFDGVSYTKIGENIWSGSNFTADDVVVAWHNSPGHRDNLQGDWVYGCGARSGPVVVYLFMR